MRSVKLINLCKHSTNLLSGGVNIPIPSSGEARILPAERTVETVLFDGNQVDLIREHRGEITNLPPPNPDQPDTYYIVSAFIANDPRVSHRTDILVGASGPEDNPVRNEKNHILAVRAVKQLL